MKNYKRYFLTSESVTEGHPDKVADLISDSILDAYLKQDENSRVAVETMLSNNKVVIAGQITSDAIIDIENIVFGYATDEKENYMLYLISIAHKISRRLADVRKNKELP